MRLWHFKRLIILGSFNDTGPANALNDENIVILGTFDESTLSTEVKKRQRQMAQYALKEIAIIKNLPENFF